MIICDTHNSASEPTGTRYCWDMWQILGSLKPPTYLQYHTHTQNARQTCVSCPLSVPSVSYGIVDLIINKFAHIGEHVVTPWCSQLRQMWKWSQQGRPHLRGFRPGGHTRPGRLRKSTIAALQAEKKWLRDGAVWQLSQDSSRMNCLSWTLS